eukprot:jgi/Tetstr1/459066/TSEL_000402.t1
MALVGVIPRVVGKGPAAASVSGLLQRLRHEVGDAGGGAATPARPLVDAAVLLDRGVDLVTPLCTQLTYEGLIDELLGIHNGTVELEGDKAAVAGDCTMMLSAP